MTEGTPRIVLVALLASLLAPAAAGSQAGGVPTLAERLAALEAAVGDLDVRGLTIAVDGEGRDVVLAGDSAWLVQHARGQVTRLRARDGYPLGVIPVGTHPYAAATDGQVIWVVDRVSDTVTVIRVEDGAVLEIMATGENPSAIACDGENFWITNAGDDTVSKFRASDGQELGVFPTGAIPWGLAFDGTHVWTVNRGDRTVTKLIAADGTEVPTSFFTWDVPSGPVAANDTTLWVASSSRVIECAADGSFVRNIALPGTVRDVGVFGDQLWVAGGNVIRRYRLSDGELDGGWYRSVSSMAWDGVGIWVADHQLATVGKL